MKNFILAIFMVMLMSMFYSCSSPTPKEYKPIDFIVNAQDTIAQGYEIMNYYSFVPDSAHPGNKYSTIDSITKYGIGMAYKIPDSLVGKELVVTIDLKVLETKNPSSGLVVTLQNSADKSNFYTVVDLASKINGKVNEWVNVSAEVIIDPISNDENSSKLHVFSFKPTGIGNLLIDDLKISLKATGNIEDEE